MQDLLKASTLSFSVIIDYKIQVNLLLPVIKELIERGYTINIYTTRPVRVLLMDEIRQNKRIIFHDLDALKRQFWYLIYIHKIIKELFTRSDFSFIYSVDPINVRSVNAFRRLLISMLRVLAKVTPSVRNNNINSFLSRIISIFSPSLIFKDKVVIAGSLNSSSGLLSGRDQLIVTFMESWDHATKVPNGYVSKIVFGWNSDLNNDWKTIQGDKNVKTFFAAKLVQSREFSKIAKRTARTIAYCVASTKRFSQSNVYDAEHQIISKLAELSYNRGLNLILKLRPNGSVQDFEDIQSSFPHISVTSLVNETVDRAPNYFLSEEYNKRRFRELEGVQCVVNAFTTFGLDAALAGFPVLQLDLSNLAGFSLSHNIFARDHIKKYLISGGYVCRPTTDFCSEVSKFLDNISLCQSYSSNLVEWLQIPEDVSIVTNAVVDEIVSLCN